MAKATVNCIGALELYENLVATNPAVERTRRSRLPQHLCLCPGSVPRVEKAFGRDYGSA